VRLQALFVVHDNASASTNTTTTSLVSTTTTATTRWPSASLFCITVVRSEGYEPALVAAQAEQGVGIFLCDEFQVFSNGGVVRLGKVTALQIQVEAASMGDLAESGTTTSSWLNTRVFMQMWDMVTADGRWWEHDFTVKTDPDAVFFPQRLRSQLLSHMPEFHSSAVYVGNCDRSWHHEPKHLKLFGSLEIFSRNAIGSYKYFEKKCKSELVWQGWGEDFFMQECLNLVGVEAFNGTKLLADARCEPSPCSDITKVVFHDFKNASTWFGCWGESQGTEDWLRFHDDGAGHLQVVMKK